MLFRACFPSVPQPSSCAKLDPYLPSSVQNWRGPRICGNFSGESGRQKGQKCSKIIGKQSAKHGNGGAYVQTAAKTAFETTFIAILFYYFIVPSRSHSILSLLFFTHIRGTKIAQDWWAHSPEHGIMIELDWIMNFWNNEHGIMYDFVTLLCYPLR